MFRVPCSGELILVGVSRRDKPGAWLSPYSGHGCGRRRCIIGTRRRVVGRHFSTVRHGDRQHGLVFGAGLHPLQQLDNFHAFNDSAKHHVLVIKVRRGLEGDKELAAVGVAAGVGHGQHARRCVLVDEVFVWKA